MFRILFICALAYLMMQCMGGCANYTVEPVLSASHTSALSRGEPFRPDKDEYNIDRVEGGITFYPTHYRNLEFDLTHGVKRVEQQDSEESTTLAVRWYPWR